MSTALNATVGGLGSVLEGVGAFSKALTGYGDTLEWAGNQMGIGRGPTRNWDINDMKNDPLGYLSDPSGLTYSAFNLVGSMIPSLAVSAATGGIGGAAIGAAGRAAGIGGRVLNTAENVARLAEGVKPLTALDRAASIAGNIAGAAAGGAVDAATEGGQTYQRALEMNYDDDTARNMALQDFGDNIVFSSLQNAISMNAMKRIGNIKNVVSNVGEDVATAGEEVGRGTRLYNAIADYGDKNFGTRLGRNILTTNTLEAYQEGLQQEFQDNALGIAPVHYNPLDMSEDAQSQIAQTFLGMVPSSGLGAVGRSRMKARENGNFGEAPGNGEYASTINNGAYQDTEDSYASGTPQNGFLNNVNNMGTLTNNLTDQYSPENGFYGQLAESLSGANDAPINSNNSLEHVYQFGNSMTNDSSNLNAITSPANNLGLIDIFNQSVALSKMVNDAYKKYSPENDKLINANDLSVVDNNGNASESTDTATPTTVNNGEIADNTTKSGKVLGNVDNSFIKEMNDVLQQEPDQYHKNESDIYQAKRPTTNFDKQQAAADVVINRAQSRGDDLLTKKPEETITGYKARIEKYILDNETNNNGQIPGASTTAKRVADLIGNRGIYQDRHNEAQDLLNRDKLGELDELKPILNGTHVPENRLKEARDIIKNQEDTIAKQQEAKQRREELLKIQQDTATKKENAKKMMPTVMNEINSGKLYLEWIKSSTPKKDVLQALKDHFGEKWFKDNNIDPEDLVEEAKSGLRSERAKREKLAREEKKIADEAEKAKKKSNKKATKTTKNTKEDTKVTEDKAEELKRRAEEIGRPEETEEEFIKHHEKIVKREAVKYKITKNRKDALANVKDNDKHPDRVFSTALAERSKGQKYEKDGKDAMTSPSENVPKILEKIRDLTRSGEMDWEEVTSLFSDKKENVIKAVVDYFNLRQSGEKITKAKINEIVNKIKKPTENGDQDKDAKWDKPIEEAFKETDKKVKEEVQANKDVEKVKSDDGENKLKYIEKNKQKFENIINRLKTKEIGYEDAEKELNKIIGNINRSKYKEESDILDLISKYSKDMKEYKEEAEAEKEADAKAAEKSSGKTKKEENKEPKKFVYSAGSDQQGIQRVVTEETGKVIEVNKGKVVDSNRIDAIVFSGNLVDSISQALKDGNYKEDENGNYVFNGEQKYVSSLGLELAEKSKDAKLKERAIEFAKNMKMKFDNLVLSKDIIDNIKSSDSEQKEEPSSEKETTIKKTNEKDKYIEKVDKRIQDVLDSLKNGKLDYDEAIKKLGKILNNTKRSKQKDAPELKKLFNDALHKAEKFKKNEVVKEESKKENEIVKAEVKKEPEVKKDEPQNETDADQEKVERKNRIITVKSDENKTASQKLDEAIKAMDGEKVIVLSQDNAKNPSQIKYILEKNVEKVKLKDIQDGIVRDKLLGLIQNKGAGNSDKASDHDKRRVISYGGGRPENSRDEILRYADKRNNGLSGESSKGRNRAFKIWLSISRHAYKIINNTIRGFNTKGERDDKLIDLSSRYSCSYLDTYNKGLLSDFIKTIQPTTVFINKVFNNGFSGVNLAELNITGLSLNYIQKIQNHIYTDTFVHENLHSVIAMLIGDYKGKNQSKYASSEKLIKKIIDVTQKQYHGKNIENIVKEEDKELIDKAINEADDRSKLGDFAKEIVYSQEDKKLDYLILQMGLDGHKKVKVGRNDFFLHEIVANKIMLDINNSHKKAVDVVFDYIISNKVMEKQEAERIREAFKLYSKDDLMEFLDFHDLNSLIPQVEKQSVEANSVFKEIVEDALGNDELVNNYKKVTKENREKLGLTNIDSIIKYTNNNLVNNPNPKANVSFGKAELEHAEQSQKIAEKPTTTEEASKDLEKAGIKHPDTVAKEAVRFGLMGKGLGVLKEAKDDWKKSGKRLTMLKRLFFDPKHIFEKYIPSAKRIYDLADKARRALEEKVAEYGKDFVTTFGGLTGAQAKGLNDYILKCGEIHRDSLTVASVGSNAYHFVLTQDDYIESFKNRKKADEQLAAIKAQGGYKVVKKYWEDDGNGSGSYTVLASKETPHVFSSEEEARKFTEDHMMKETVNQLTKDGKVSKSDAEVIGKRYELYRKLMDKAWADLVASAKAVGYEKIPKRRNGYYPHMHLPYLVLKRVKNGDKVTWERVESFYNASEAAKKTREMIDNGEEAKFMEMSIADRYHAMIDTEASVYTQEELDNLLEGKTISEEAFKEITELLDNDNKELKEKLQPLFGQNIYVTKEDILKFIDKKLRDGSMAKKQAREAGLKNMLNKTSPSNGLGYTYQEVEAMINRGNTNPRFAKHLLAQSDKKGYSLNVPDAVYRYLIDVANYTAKAEFQNKADKVYHATFGTDRRKEAPKTEEAKFVSEYITANLGVRNITAFDNMINEAINSIPGLGYIIRKYYSPNAYTDTAGKILGLQNVLKLGMFNPSAFLVQSSQLLNANAKLAGNGKLGKIFGFSKEFKYGIKMAYGNGKKADAKYKELFDFIGLDNKRFALDSELLGKAPSLSERRIYGDVTFGKMMDKSMLFFEQGDTRARKASAIASYEKALKEGKSKEEAQKIAKSFVTETNFDYSVVNTPLGLTKLGVTGKILLQFKKYPLFTLNFLAHSTGAERVRFIVPLVLLAGCFGVPCGDLFDEASKGITGRSPKLFLKKNIMEWAGNDPAKKAIANVAMYGAPSLAGINLSNRVGLNDAISLDAGPTISTAQNLWRAVFDSRDVEGMATASTKAISPMIGNVASAISGKYENTRGETVTEYEAWQRAMKAVGFKPVTESQASDSKQIITYMRKKYSQAVSDAKTDYRKDPSTGNYQALKIYGLSDKDIAKVLTESKETVLEKSKKQVPNSKNNSTAATDLRDTYKAVNDFTK